MSLKGFFFLFIILNSSEYVLPSRSCVRCNWNALLFRFMKHYRYPSKDTFCNMAYECLADISPESKTCEEKIKVTFPVISRYSNATLRPRLPKPVLAMKQEFPSTTSQTLSALGKMWRLLVFCPMAAILSGIIIWFLDHKANSGHFPKSFWRGTREGLWWAIVTMTTTGYGDKIPRSSLARAYASLWMIMGLVLMSIITAQVSSSLTADEMQPLDEVFGDKVGVPLGSKEFFRNVSWDTESLTEYGTEKELFESLVNGTEDKIWLFGCEERTEHNFMIVKIYYEEELTAPFIGVDVQVPPRTTADKGNFTNCLTKKISDYVRNNSKNTENSENSENSENDAEHRHSSQRICFDSHSRGKNRKGRKGPLKETMKRFDYVLCGFAAVIIGLFMVGTLWEVFMRTRRGENVEVTSVDVEKGEGPLALELKTTRESRNGTIQ